jgi:hypothetical protein
MSSGQTIPSKPSITPLHQQENTSTKPESQPQSALPNDDFLKSQELNKCVLPTSGKISDQAIDLGLVDRDILSWTENRYAWKANLRLSSSKLTDNIMELAHSSRCFLPDKPLNITPSVPTILQAYENVSGLQEFIKKLQTSLGTHSAFAIASSSWTDTFRHSSQVTRPGCHLLDVFVVTDDGAVHLWSVFTSSVHTDHQWEYLMEVGRLTKLKLITGTTHTEVPDQFHIQCHHYSLETKDTRSTTAYRKAPNCSLSITCRMLASLLLQRETYICNHIGERYPFNLTSTQMEHILETDSVSFNYIEGSPGSGKTFIAFYLCEKFGRNNTVVICSTKPYFKLLR